MRHLIRPPKSEGYPTVVTTELSNRASSFIHSSEAGFSLIEAAVAMVVILVAMLGVFFAFTYAINYNAGNSSRVKVLAILQREVEQMRSAKFTPGTTDPILQGHAETSTTVTDPNNSSILYTIATTVDNDPFTADVQDEATAPTTKIKEITITATLASPSPGWQTAIPAKVVFRRVMSN